VCVCVVTTTNKQINEPHNFRCWVEFPTQLVDYLHVDGEGFHIPIISVHGHHISPPPPPIPIHFDLIPFPFDVIR